VFENHLLTIQLVSINGIVKKECSRNSEFDSLLIRVKNLHINQWHVHEHAAYIAGSADTMCRW
jgi:hypothetical protein